MPPTSTQSRELHLLKQEVSGAGGVIKELEHENIQGRVFIPVVGRVLDVPFRAVVFPTGRIVYGYPD